MVNAQKLIITYIKHSYTPVSTTHSPPTFYYSLSLIMTIAKLALAIAMGCLIASSAAREMQLEHVHDLSARIEAEGGMTQCFNALYELRACTNEIILFFFNGESYLSLDCCRAIRVITLHCWPAMLASVGFTLEEADILRGYCDASVDSGSSPPPGIPGNSGSPAAEPSPATVV
ncbi:egg cell-secreted protein 1.2-like [Aristolochia californica]|uniref:egg cell-secreted protein 1.2-like n=1 Tax=Aristolochia californica TaxID=171875 RepID=UPI0035DC7ED8